MEPKELDLRLGSGRYSSSASSSSSYSDRNPPICISRSGSSDEHRRQPITIFYNGRICASDVSDLQARSIIEMAKIEVDHGKRREELGKWEEGSSPPAEPQLMNPGLSMKRSLQRFLQKRKARIADHASPYSCSRQPLQLFSS
ncbi:Protein TIFY 5A [Apostasia shenzhenica]|uniref:Protein TIFY 5A n=1 Tax=Apostasia shenzhenica TaxID=1088818 RepID=A0A2I0BE26_9ASPA|nr:Protein TIFY 5A [Apostasia shenzhenica]